MKVLWLTFGPLPQIKKKIEPKSEALSTGGWLQGLSKNLITDDEVTFCYCFPYEKLTSGTVDNYKYVTIPQVTDGSEYSLQEKEYIKDNIQKFNPDIIHLFGTEHSLQTNLIKIVHEMGLADKLVIWIQGVVSVYVKHYNAGLPEKVIKSRTLKEYIKRNNIEDMKAQMANRGNDEIEALKLAKHVFVRTDWDLAAIKAINPNLNIHYCNESLRSSFYTCDPWNEKALKSHRIFMSQSNYPIKGLHMMLEALSIIKREFPDVHIYTTGKDYLNYKTFKDKLRISSYQKYIMSLLDKYGLKDNITILGTLSEQEMLEQYQKASVFVSASSVENSPNSLGEAMLVGTPCVVSDVGGVKNMMKHGEEGFVYPFDEPCMLAEYVCEFFRNSELAKKMSINARNHAKITHNVELNYEQMKKEYINIIGK